MTMNRPGRAVSPFAMTRVAALALVAAACGGEMLPLQGPGADTTTGGSGGATAGNGASGGGAGVGGAGGTAGVGEAGAVGEAGTGGSAVTGPDPSAVDLTGTPVYTRVQRLTLSQWQHAVVDILRLDAPVAAFRAPPLTDDFTNNEKFLFVEHELARELEANAEAAAAAATASAETLSRVYAGTDAAGFIRTLGKRAFRRPLTAEEETRYAGMFTLGETLHGTGFANGASFVIRAFLQSPHFLYRSELGPGNEPLSGHEVASKLSFWLLDTTPSDALLDAGLAGALDSVAGLEAAAREMLEDPRAVAVMRDFHGQAYNFAAYGNVEKSDTPAFTPASKDELTSASNAFFDRVFADGAGLTEILTSTRAYVGPGLAAFYGIDPAPPALEERAMDPSRSGFFMQVPFLLQNGRDFRSSATARGVSLSTRVLCVKLPAPPGEIPALPEPVEGRTGRQDLEAATAACGVGCHVYFDPLGFALENFDGVGHFRDADRGLPIDAGAEFPFAEGNRSFAEGTELMQIMADGTQAHACYAKKLSSYALQRDIVADDRPLLDSLAAVSKDERSLKEMAVALVRDAAFRLRKEVTP
jgi:hypothetical protein